MMDDEPKDGEFDSDPDEFNVMDDLGDDDF